ncbi:36.4 kDa proline-rich protein-like [Cryptomeria japonica]|uniref:36.4 kDa proline-rich protein-like n=1 Tax=Cryptomeria japonica TaxID=3369 RepID=UPI0025AB8F0E|nr:36.4 kDa proline-rich protein-like [Cryptomeria japonica]
MGPPAAAADLSGSYSSCRQSFSAPAAPCWPPALRPSRLPAGPRRQPPALRPPPALPRPPFAPRLPMQLRPPLTAPPRSPAAACSTAPPQPAASTALAWPDLLPCLGFATRPPPKLYLAATGSSYAVYNLLQ